MNRQPSHLLTIITSAVFFVICAHPLLAGQTQVPFVGCKADGQAGPLDAPIGKYKTVPAAPEIVQRLAYYKAEQGVGVLAPRGWFCFEIYGSNGSALYISPQPIDTEGVFSGKWSGFTGPVIELSTSFGGTSGRFGVAFIIARVFPAHRAFVRKVVKENYEPTNSFQFGPYPKDKLVYKSKVLVEFETPPETDGLGTTSRLKKNAGPISGVAILVGQTPDLVHLSVRLPSELRELSPAIIQNLERDALDQP